METYILLNQINKTSRLIEVAYTSLISSEAWSNANLLAPNLQGPTYAKTLPVWQRVNLRSYGPTQKAWHLQFHWYTSRYGPYYDSSLLHDYSAHNSAHNTTFSAFYVLPKELPPLGVLDQPNAAATMPCNLSLEVPRLSIDLWAGGPWSPMQRRPLLDTEYVEVTNITWGIWTQIPKG